MLAALLPACAPARYATEAATIPITVSSHNRSTMDVYVLCGNHDAEWLGEAGTKWVGLFEVSAARTRCLEGTNFFLVSRDVNRGYWVGPVHLRPGAGVYLTIEKYVRLSTAKVTRR